MPVWVQLPPLLGKGVDFFDFSLFCEREFHSVALVGPGHLSV